MTPSPLPDRAPAAEPASRLRKLPPDRRRLVELMTRARQAQPDALGPAASAHPVAAPLAPTGTTFSLFFFADADTAAGRGKYDLLLDCARFADAQGFSGIWTPERHFHRFGGLYPNPAVTGAALAAITNRLEIRGGSVVLPLNDPIRVAEEWSVVDNLSNGRAAIACASGWHGDDFVLAPAAYDGRRQRLVDDVATIRTLWRGERIRRARPDGELIEVGVFPRPVRAALPIWVTSAGSPETFRLAGRLGAHLLTSLIGQDVAALAGNIALYRRSLREHGFDGRAFTAAVMLHTFLGSDLAAVRRTVEPAMTAYLRNNIDLYAHLFAAASGQPGGASLTAAEEAEVLVYAFDRYFSEAALLGTVESCMKLVRLLAGAGVDEIACLLDFGLDRRTVLGGLEQLAVLADVCAAKPALVAVSPTR